MKRGEKVWHIGVMGTPHGYLMHTIWVSHVRHMGITCTRAGHYIGVVDVQKEQKC